MMSHNLNHLEGWSPVWSTEKLAPKKESHSPWFIVSTETLIQVLDMLYEAALENSSVQREKNVELFQA